MDLTQLDFGQLSNLGATAIVAIFAFYFMWKNNKNNKKENGGNKLDKQILTELQTMNQNHLNALKTCIEDGNRELRDTLHDDNVRIIEILGRIDGKLSR